MATINVSSGVTSNLIMSSGDILNVFSSGKVVSTTVQKGGLMEVFTGGVASTYWITSSGSARILAGGTAVRVRVNKGGFMWVSSGGTAINVLVDSTGYLDVSPGGWASSVELMQYANLNVSSGGIVYNTTVSAASATVFVREGGVMSGLVLSGGRLIVSSGGIVSGATISSGVSAHTSGVIFSARISSGARAFVSSAGTMTSATVYSGGSVDVKAGGSALATAISGGSVYLDSAFARGTLIETGQLNLSNGVASATTVSAGGALAVYYNGSANETTLRSNGELYLFDGGRATGTTVSSDGRMHVYSGCSANSTTVASEGILDIYGTANNTTVISSGRLFIYSGATVSGLNVSHGYISPVSQARLSDLKLGWTQLVLSSGATLSGATVDYRASLLLYSGATMSGVTVSSGGTMCFAGGTAYDTVLKDGATMSRCDDGGKAVRTTIGSGVVFWIREGFIAESTTISSGGHILVYTSASANSVTVKSGGTVTVGLDGILRSCTVSGGGILEFSTSSASLTSTTVLSGGTATGKFNCSAFTISSGATVDFDIVYESPGSSGVLVAGLSTAVGAGAVYSLNVKSNSKQANGTYKLASGASGFNKTITVYNQSGTSLGTLTVGQTANIGGVGYRLDLDSDILSVSVGAASLAPARSDINANGKSDVMFQYTGGQGQIGFWMDGTSSWQSTNSTHPVDTWEVLGAYDMNANGKADSVLVGNTEINGIRGAFIGYYTDSSDYDSNWVNISYLTNYERYVWKNKVGNLTGNAGKNSIVWHTTDIGALGVWTDGTDSWISLGAGYDANWTLIGCGDFTGSGKDTVVMSYLGGAKYYAVGIDGVAKELATSDSGWEVRAIADFAGDGKDDIIAFHKETGIVAKWNNGSSTGSSWSQLGQLDPKDWFVAGAGDYNGDGKDDLLVRQYSTGMLGYYSAGNMSNWTELGRGVDMSWTVIA